MPLLVPHLSSTSDGMRSAAASTLRNVYVLNEETRDKFVSLGGPQKLMPLLDIGNAANFDVQFETIFNLEDLITVDGEIKKSLAKAVLDAGGAQRLQNLTTCQDDEVQELASSLLARMQDAI